MICARHGCEHDETEHPQGACKAAPRCPCQQFLLRRACLGIPPIITRTTSGKRYQRCACGHVTTLAPEIVVNAS